MKAGGRSKEKNSTRVLRREWELVLALAATKHGLTADQLCEKLGCSVRTVYRDVENLEAAGVPMTRVTVNGQVRHRLMRDLELPPLGFTSLQIAALHLARVELEALAGTGLVTELDGLLEKLRPPEKQARFSFAAGGSAHADVLEAVERAQRAGKRLRLVYRAASRGGATTEQLVEPHLLRVSDRQPYLHGYCVNRGAARTYKVARVVRAEVTDEDATHPAPSGDAFAHARKVWSGEVVTVRARLDPEVAWFAEEYPLHVGQRVVTQPDGGVTVEARVAGVVEALRWALSWGGSIEVLEPPALRGLIGAEVRKAALRYRPAAGGGAVKIRRAPAQVGSRKVAERGRRVGA
jgi:predicted DNA-binding transcriptional regulator YafY